MAKGTRGGKRANGAKSHGKAFGNTRGHLDSSSFDSDVDAIMKETGMSEEQSKKLVSNLEEYLGWGYGEYTRGNRQKETKELDEMLSRMGTYDGTIYRGMKLKTQEDIDNFTRELSVGSEISMKSVSSWSSDKLVAKSFSQTYKDGQVGVIIKSVNNKSGASIEHISGQKEKEVMMPSTAKFKVKSVNEVVKKTGFYPDIKYKRTIEVEVEEL